MYSQTYRLFLVIDLYESTDTCNVLPTHSCFLLLSMSPHFRVYESVDSAIRRQNRSGQGSSCAYSNRFLSILPFTVEYDIMIARVRWTKMYRITVLSSRRDVKYTHKLVSFPVGASREDRRRSSPHVANSKGVPQAIRRLFCLSKMRFSCVDHGPTATRDEATTSSTVPSRLLSRSGSTFASLFLLMAGSA